MNKLFFLFLSFISSVNTYAQNDTTGTVYAHNFKNNFYIRGGIGYAFSHSGNVENSVATAFNVKHASYTSGMNGSLGCGYMFGSHIGVELNGTFILPGEKYNYTTFSGGNNNATYEITMNTQATMLLMPALLLQTATGRFNVYTRLSMVLPVVNKISINESFFNSPGNPTAATGYIHPSFTVGYSCAAGLSYKAGRHINVWAEMSALSLTPYVTEIVMGHAAQNINSSLVNSDLSQKLGQYAFQTSYSSSATNKPAQPTYTLPYSNIGMQAGISFNIGNKPALHEASSKADKYLYIKGGIGYAFPMGNNTSSILHYSGYQTDQVYASGMNPLDNISYKGRPASFTAGLSEVAGAGYMTGKHFGVELDASIGGGSKKYTYTLTSISSIVYYQNYTTSVVSHAATPVMLMPCFVMQTGGKVINIYSRLGIALPVSGKLIADDHETTYNGATTIVHTVYTTKFTLGYTGAAGIKYRLTPILQLFAEVNLLSYEPYVKEAKMSVGGNKVQSTQYATSGQLQGGYYLTSSGALVFYSGTAFLAQPTYTLPYSSAGTQVGVYIRM